MIVRLIVIDPRGIRRDKAGRDTDILAYQVPEKSREMELLQELFSAHGVEWTVMSGPKRNKS